jgi:hypothetical protein
MLTSILISKSFLFRIQNEQKYIAGLKQDSKIEADKI